jgi:hypothetical protein
MTPGPDVLPVAVPFPDDLRDAPAGLLPPARFTRTEYGLRVDRDAPAAYRPLLDVVDAWAPLSWRHGTITGRVIDDPCPAGDWHVDDGTVGERGGLRFAVTIAADPGLLCGHEFRAVGEPLPSGTVVMFRDDEHRRPAVPVAVRRVFLSAAVYRWGVPADLSCVGLAPLRGAS